MTRSDFFFQGMTMRVIRVIGFSWLLAIALPAAAQSPEASIRSELAAPLQEVQRLFKDKQYAPALKALGQAEAVPNRTEEENILIERLRAASAVQAGDLDQAALAYDRLANFGKVAATERLTFLEVLATLHLRRKAFADSARAASRYINEGGKKPSVRLVLAQAAFFANDPAATVGQTAELIALARQTGTSPEKDVLILQANAQQRLKDETGYSKTLELLVAFYPQPAYWADLLGRVQSEPGFPAEALIDLYRLQLATGSLGVGEALEMAQLAIKQGFPSEAVRALKQAEPVAQSPDEKAQVLQALKNAEQLVAADSAAAVATPATPSKPGTAKTQADAKVVAAGKAPRSASFASLYQKWLTQAEAPQAKAIEAFVVGDQATPLNRLRLGAVLAQTGMTADAKAVFEALQSQGAAAGRLAGLWLLHLNKVVAP